MQVSVEFETKKVKIKGMLIEHKLQFIILQTEKIIQLNFIETCRHNNYMHMTLFTAQL